MPEGTKSRNSMDSTELWKQWYETSARMWSSAMDGGKEAYVDPYGFYRLWLKSMGNTQEQMKTVSLGTMNTKEIWNQWYEATVGAWRKATEMGGDPLGLTTQWLDMMEEMRKRIMSSNTLPTDPFSFFKEWYEATSETWAGVVDEMISSEKFIESASPFLEVYATFTKTLRRANEEYFKSLQLPTRSELARVAGLIVTLEEKVDKIEDAFENVEDSYANMPTREGFEGLSGRMGEIESKLDTLSADLEKQHTAGSADTAGAIGTLTSRLDEVESKLDRVLTALEKLAVREQVEMVKSPDTEQRSRPQKKSSKLSLVQDTQTTVE
ncbi:MAG: hypothetical protein NVS4B7_09600 [Ktedonobacteraceae bacterium]